MKNSKSLNRLLSLVTLVHLYAMQISVRTIDTKRILVCCIFLSIVKQKRDDVTKFFYAKISFLSARMNEAFRGTIMIDKFSF